MRKSKKHWSDGTDYKPTPVDIERQRRQRERERAETLQGIGWARKLWAEGKPFRGHKYLADKGLGLEGCHHLRTWEGSVWIDRERQILDTWLLAPLYWRDRLVNVQRISGEGLKRQMKHAPQKACYLMLNRPRWAVTIFCEGLATGLAVYQAVRSARVVVCFFSDNLVPVLQEIKPTGTVVFAADNDWKTALKPHMHGVNPGIKAAQNAAELIGAGVAWPEGIQGSDWADAAKEWGERSARRIERQILAGARYVPSTAREAPA